MKDLIKEYEDKLSKVEKSIETTSNNGSQNDIAKMSRLRTQAIEYQIFIDKLCIVKNSVPEGHDKEISELSKLYWLIPKKGIFSKFKKLLKI